MGINWTMHRKLIFIIVIRFAPLFYGLQYKWLQYDDRFDCVVGIAVDGKPVNMGVWIAKMVVLTSLNPIYKYRNLPIEERHRIAIHSVYGKYNVSWISSTTVIWQWPTNHRPWIRQGFDHKHTPIHDLLLLTAQRDELARKVRPRHAMPLRFPFITPVATLDKKILRTRGWYFVGFGYIDQKHVEDNQELELEYYHNAVLVDCDEWIPRKWGLFICISNVDNYPCVASGSPLYYKGRLYGIGNFAMKKGQESILVFTDFRHYIHHKVINSTLEFYVIYPGVHNYTHNSDGYIYRERTDVLRDPPITPY